MFRKRKEELTKLTKIQE